jgi:glycosyltransferase involved in cell wall biosynthesis
VLEQDFADFEIIVGDDSGGSLQATVEAFHDPRLLYIPNPVRLGYAGNHCALINRAHGDFIAFLQHDDLWYPKFLSEVVRVLEAQSNVGLVIAGSNDIDTEGHVLARRPTRMQNGLQQDPLCELLRRDCMVFLPSATVVRRSAVQADMKPWPDNNVADLAMYVDLALAGHGFYYLDQPLLGYRMHLNQLSAINVLHRNSLIDLWSRYKFVSPAHDEMRRAMLAQAYMARAGTHLRNNQSSPVRVDLDQARKIMPGTFGLRWLTIWGISFVPWLIPLAVRLRGMVHDPVKNRFKGV